MTKQRIKPKTSGNDFCIARSGKLNFLTTVKNLSVAILITVFLAACASEEVGVGAGAGNNNNNNNGNGDNNENNNESGGNINTTELDYVDFQATLYPVLVSQCSACHGSQGPLSTPDFAHEDVATAYSVVISNTLANLGNPVNSRLVQKPLLLHRCTQPTCQGWSDNIRDAIVSWANIAAGTEVGAGVNGKSIVSAALTLADGIKSAGAGRVEDAIIAKYTFKSGTGTTALDTSGVTPAMDLMLSADVTWVAGQGIEIADPNAVEESKAVATPAASKKLYDMIAGPTGSKQYTIEAWIINASTALTGPARIVSYSDDFKNRNFTMGQVMGYYNYRNRTDLTGLNGSMPALESDNNGGALKAELQHVVFTFDSTNGRNIYVNGIKTTYEGVDSDPAVLADVSNWDSTYTFILGNEVPDLVHRQWLGKMLFVGIHNRALTPAEILQNTLAGVGEKYILSFDVSTLLDTTGNTTSMISLTVSELDDYSYVFGKPTFTTDILVPNVPIKNIRIAVNNNVPAAAQSFRNVDTSVNSSDVELSPLGAVIPRDLGPDEDRFSLVFEVLGNNTNVVVVQNPTPVPDTYIPPVVPIPEVGLRTFEQINNTMSVLTGVDKSVTAATFDSIKQQLPGTPNLGSFVSAHQIGVAKLSLEYCDALVESASPIRTAMFGNTFQFTSAVATAFSDQSKRDIIITNLVDKMVGVNLSQQPTLAELKPDLDQLINELSAGCNVAADCNAARTRTIVKAACAAVLGSAVVLIN